MPRLFLRFAVFLALVASFLNGCRPGPIFTGRLILYSDKLQKVFEIKVDSTTGEPTVRDIALDIAGAAVSPDNRYLLYATKIYNPKGSDEGKTWLRDLRTGEIKELFPHTVNGLAWAPDSQRFSYSYSHELSISDLTGQSRVIYKDLSALYRPEVGLGNPAPIFFSSSAAVWVGADRLILQRRTNIPWKMGMGGGLPPDTTTLIVIGDVPKLIDAPKRWYVGSQCSHGPFILFGEKAGGNSVWEYNVVSPSLITQNFNDFESVKFDSLPYHNCRFMPTSCKLYCTRTGDPSPHNTIYLFDPATLKELSSITLGKDCSLGSALVDPEEKYIALIYSVGSGSGGSNLSYYLSIIDLDTEGETILLKGFESNWKDRDFFTGKLKFLAWLQP